MDDHIDALPPGYRIREYEILRVLGTGGFGITYLAHDTSLDRDVAIKECYPRLYAARTKDYSIRPRSRATSEDHAWALDRFLEEARTLAHYDLDHPNIVRVYARLEHHGTEHIVMRYVEGETLNDRLKREGKLNEADLIAMLDPLAQGLEQVHKAGILHRDITPKNILLKKDGAPVLVDFGSARRMVDARSGGVTKLATSGYAAPEQSSSREKEGAWTDIYGLSAVAYRCITGTAPIDALERRQGEELGSASKAGRGSYSEGLLTVVDSGLSLKSEERPHDLKAWRAAHMKASTAAAQRHRLAAEQGDARAQFLLGTMHYHGRDVSRDRAEAMKWYRLAAEQGDSYAQSMIGFMYENGEGVGQDDAEATKWYRLAAEQGMFYAQYTLGLGQLHQLIASADAYEHDVVVKRSSVERYLTDFSAGLATDELSLLSTAFTAENFLWTNDQSTDLSSGLDKDNPKQVAAVLTALKRQIAADAKLADRWRRHYKMLEDMRKQIIGNGILPEDRIKPITRYHVMSEATYWYRLAIGQSAGASKDDLKFLRLRLLAGLGNAAAQFELGYIYGEMEGTARDDVESVKWFRLAAEQGNANAQYGLGVMYSEGRGVTLDDTEAVKWLRRAAEQGNAAAQGDLGIMYAKSRGVTPNDVEAVKWLRRAAEQDYPGAQWYLGFMYSEGRGLRQDDVEAVKWLQRAAEQQVAVAQWYLGFMYFQGRGVDQDDAEAVKWFRSAAEQAYDSAQFALGTMYEKGRGVEQNEAQAIQWFLKAAEQKHTLAQTHLWGLYSRGRGVPQDDDEALRWCLLPANQGDAFAQCAVGVMYEKGRGAAQDDAEAVTWYRRAAEQGYGRAQFYLGVMYLEGRGLRCASDSDNDEDRARSDAEKEQDWEEASRLFELAAERGVASAKWYRGCMTHMLVYVNDENARMWRQKAALEGDPAAQYVLGVKEQEDQWEEGPYYPGGLHRPEGWYWMAAENKALHRLPVSSSDSGWLFDVIDVMYAEGRWKQEDDDAYGLQSYWMAKEQGSSLVQYELGVMYEEGLHTFDQDDAKAVEWYQRAAEQGNADAQHALAEMYSKGRGVTQIMATAVDYYRLAASQGHTEAQFSLGLIYHDPVNRQVPVWWEDQEEAMKWFRMAGEQGHLASQSILREAYHEGRFVPEDDKEAIKWALLAAKQGDGEAQYFLGVMHAEGRGVTRDDGEAVRWYRRAAEQGNGEAQYALGFMYAEARGVTQDDAEAVKWYRLAADQDPYAGIGDALARYALGFMYAEGRGVAQNNAEAVKWFRLSAKEGYGYSWSVPDGSDAQATEQYRLAAELGDAQAQFSLGFLYGEGRGVAQDDAEAVKWYRLATKQWPPSRNIPTV